MTFPKTLVAEDDPNDALLLHWAFKRAGIDATVHFVSDGVEAIDYLRGKQLFEKVASSTLPGMFLLDLEMPRFSGFGVLEWLRKHPHLRPYRVVVFSSCDDARDIVRAIPWEPTSAWPRLLIPTNWPMSSKLCATVFTGRLRARPRQ